MVLKVIFIWKSLFIFNPLQHIMPMTINDNKYHCLGRVLEKKPKYMYLKTSDEELDL